MSGKEQSLSTKRVPNTTYWNKRVHFHSPVVHGSPFLSFAIIVNFDLCPTFPRLRPGPSAHDSIGNR